MVLCNYRPFAPFLFFGGKGDERKKGAPISDLFFLLGETLAAIYYGIHLLRPPGTRGVIMLPETA